MPVAETMKIMVKLRRILICVLKKSGKHIRLFSYLALARGQTNLEKDMRRKMDFVLNNILQIGKNTEKVPAQKGIGKWPRLVIT